MKLSELPLEAKARVLRIQGSGAVSQRLLDMGIGRGTELTLVRHAPLRDPIEINVKGYSLALRKAEADLVEVEMLDHGTGEAVAVKPVPRIALAGNPNCGKTSLFNELTGSMKEVGNFPGVTVEYALGHAEIDGRPCQVVDLPGTYSLTAYSLDELVARNYLLNEKPEILLNVVDASMLDRQLYLTVQLLELRLPTVIVLNMIDIAERHGIQIDADKLSKMLGVPVVKTSAGTKQGLEELRAACASVIEKKTLPSELSYSHELEDILEPVEDVLKARPELNPGYPDRWLALKLLEHDSGVEKISKENSTIQDAVSKAEKMLKSHSGEEPSLAISEGRLGIAAGIVMDCVKNTKNDRKSVTERIDSWLCNRYMGPLFLFAIVYLLFTAIFGLAEDLHWIPLFNGEWVSPCGLFEMFFDNLGKWANNVIVNPTLRSLVRDGIIAGVGGVLSFVPLIFVMFLCIAILEDTGYIARVAFILDRVLRIFGLQGKSILALIVSGGLGGGGCAVPGIMAARTLREERDRLITILVVPLMNCGAKFPLYALLIGAFFARYQGAMMFLLWLLSWIFSMTAAFLLRKIVIRGEQTPFIMELPVYHLPKLRGVLQHTWMRTWMYVRKAGTVILGISTVIWALMYFPGPNMKQYEAERAEIIRSVPEGQSRTDRLEALDKQVSGTRLKDSFAGRLGRVIEPISRLAGFGWKENVALFGGFAAKEIVVGTLATAYSMDDQRAAGDSIPLSKKLQMSNDWSPLKAFALMIFVMLYAPCVATIAAIRKETGSWKWTFFAFSYTTVFAFVIAVLIYQTGLLF